MSASIAPIPSIAPDRWRVVNAADKRTGERREYGLYEAWGRRYWSADNGRTWGYSRRQARQLAAPK